jgi:hypothetical protein
MGILIFVGKKNVKILEILMGNVFECRQFEY